MRICSVCARSGDEVRHAAKAVPVLHSGEEPSMFLRRGLCLALLMATMSLAPLLSGCAGGAAGPGPQGGFPAIADAPANHGLSPGERIAVGAGHAEERGNVTIHCPADASTCIVVVASDGSLGYDPSGGVPAVTPRRPAGDPVAEGFERRLAAATFPIVSSFGGAVATCAAEGCPVIDAIHVDRGRVDVDLPDLRGFERLAPRRGIALARKGTTREAGAHSDSHRLFGGWMEHGFFLLETLGAGVDEYFVYHTFWLGDASHTGPVSAPGGTATWSGVMSGVATGVSGDAGAFVHGDAAVRVSGLGGRGDASVDVLFGNIVREDTGAGIADMAWRGLRLPGRSFGTDDVLFNEGAGYFRKTGFGTASGSSLFGHVYGPNGEEVGGLFHHDGIAGAFAAGRAQ